MQQDEEGAAARVDLPLREALRRSGKQAIPPGIAALAERLQQLLEARADDPKSDR